VPRQVVNCVRRLDPWPSDPPSAVPRRAAALARGDGQVAAARLSRLKRVKATQCDSARLGSRTSKLQLHFASLGVGQAGVSAVHRLKLGSEQDVVESRGSVGRLDG